jgi:hypothetical protein
MRSRHLDPSASFMPYANRGLIRSRTAIGARWSRVARPSDRGSITLLVLVFFIALLAAAGLVVDGGAKLRAARQASAVAEEAARAGAGQIDRNRAYARGGRFVIDRQAAANAARSYLTNSGNTGSISVTGTQTISVTVTITRPTILLSAIGIDHIHVTKTATADLVQGVEAPDR